MKWFLPWTLPALASMSISPECSQWYICTHKCDLRLPNQIHHDLTMNTRHACLLKWAMCVPHKRERCFVLFYVSYFFLYFPLGFRCPSAVERSFSKFTTTKHMVSDTKHDFGRLGTPRRLPGAIWEAGVQKQVKFSQNSLHFRGSFWSIFAPKQVTKKL